MKITSVMIDARDPDRLVEFWGGLLGVGVRHRELEFIWLDRVEGGWSLAFQKVDEPTPGKNKIHLDGHAEDLDALEARIVELGGRRVEEHVHEDFVWRVFADPEDNVFCFGHAL